MDNINIKIINHPEETFFESILIAARNCYSSNPILKEEIFKMNFKRGYELILELWKAGHNTVFEHFYLTFFIDGVTRHFVYKYLHYLTPFYSTDQQSQRYTEIKEIDIENYQKYFFIPDNLNEEDKTKWIQFFNYTIEKYKELTDKIEKVIDNDPDYSFDKNIKRKKALEFARYVLPLGIKTKLTYTVNLATLLRILAYLRNLNENDECYLEAQEFVNKINQEINNLLDKHYQKFLNEFKDYYENKIAKHMNEINFSNKDEVKILFDLIEKLEINYLILTRNPKIFQNLYNKLFDIAVNSYDIIQAVKINKNLEIKKMENVIDILNKKDNKVEILKVFMPDIIECKTDTDIVFNPLNYYESDKFIYTVGLLSHSAESQNQRHRTTIKVPIELKKYFNFLKNKYYIPRLFFKENYKEILKEYKSTIEKIYSFFNEEKSKYGFNNCIYLLPNAQYVLVYNVDILKYFKHKVQKRLCYNSQEEIWHFTFEQVKQLKDKFDIDIYKENLLPPCTINYKHKVTPYCTEGPRFCGTKVWKLSFAEMKREY